MKFTSLLICTSMILSISAPCFADGNNVKMEKALMEVKTRLNIGDFDNFDSEYRTDDEGNTEYHFFWENNDEDEYENINVSYSEGVIVGYDHSFKDEYKSDIKISETNIDAAREAVEEFIKNANPDIYQNIKIVENSSNSLGGSSYYFSLIRIEDGVPVIGSGGNIAVSKATNKIRYFHINYDTDIKFIKSDNILNLEEGKTAYAKNLAPKLQYASNYDYSKKELSVFSRYVSQDRNLMINAGDGSIYEASGDAILKNGSLEQNAKSEASMDMAAGREFSPAEIIELDKIAELISEKEAEELARKNKIMNLDANLKLNNIRLVRDYIDEEKYSYTLSFEKKEDENKYSYADVTVDAKNGDILGFYKSGDYTKEDVQNLETELKKADEALKAFTGDKYTEFKLEENEAEGSVSYQRIHNGTEVSGDGARFRFDSNDELISYTLDYTAIKEFPSLDQVLTSEEAFYKACENIDFALAYSVDYESKIAVLVYCFLENDRVQSFELNSHTGALIDYRGEDIKEEELIAYSDIEDHYAKDKFLKLATFGIGFFEEELKPSMEITQAEYLTLLNKVFGYGSDIEEIYKRSFSNGIITKEEREDNSPVTREKAAIFMIKEMGADEYAKHNEIFAMPFSDVTENKGYIGLLKAFGVVSGDGNGNFNPKNTITRGEALIMIYNYLDR